MSHSANQTAPVTLNLFQGPSRRHAPERAAVRLDARCAHSVSPRKTVCAEKWTLKQVQGDEIGGGVK